MSDKKEIALYDEFFQAEKELLRRQLKKRKNPSSEYLTSNQAYNLIVQFITMGKKESLKKITENEPDLLPHAQRILALYLKFKDDANKRFKGGIDLNAWRKAYSESKKV